MGLEGTVELAYSKKDKQIQLLVPKGTSLADISRITETVFNDRDIMAKLPRGCLACHSGDHLNIREKLGREVRIDLKRAAGVKIDLEKMAVVEELGQR